MKKELMSTLTTLLFAVSVVVLLQWGWSQRFEYWLRAEEGLGYFFGIAGATMMLLLLLYPLRKKLRIMQGVLSVRHWFRLHMLFGILGPVLILFHCNFGFGSFNSNVALCSMLLVVFSGLVGRYIYRHTHSGLYGKKLDFEQMRELYFERKNALLAVGVMDDEQRRALLEIEALMTMPHESMSQSWNSAKKANQTTRKLLKSVGRKKRGVQQLEATTAAQYQQFIQHLTQEMKLIRSIVGLSFYTKLFSLWHVLHLPFFFMLVLTATVHVFVVHMY